MFFLAPDAALTVAQERI